MRLGKERQDALSDSSWFQSLTQGAQDRVRREACETPYRAGETVTRLGEQARNWIGVADGLVKISAVQRSGRVVMFSCVPEGSWIGEGAVLKNEQRRYEIIAMRDSRIVHVSASTFRWLLETSMPFNHFVIAQLNERLSQYIGLFDTERLIDPAARVARTIALLYNPVLYPRMTAHLPLSQTELGELVGLCRQSVGTALKRLEADGLIAVWYGGITILKLAGLLERDDRDNSTNLRFRAQIVDPLTSRSRQLT